MEAIELQREVNTRTTHELLAKKEQIQRRLKHLKDKVDLAEVERKASAAKASDDADPAAREQGA